MKRFYNILLVLILVISWLPQSYAQTIRPQLSERMPWETGDDDSEKDVWKFSTTYRIELGFQQPNFRTDSTTNNTYYNGGKIGFLIDFNMPYNMGIQTGLRYELTYGVNTQHYRSADNANVGTEYVRHSMLKHNISMPLRVVYTQQLWRELAMTFYTGPTFQIGLALTDNVLNALSDSTLSWLQNYSPDPSLVKTGTHDYYADNIYRRFNVQWGIGGGLQWRNWRLEGGYNFGLNNLAKYQPNTGKTTHLNEWSWEVSVIYTINYTPFDPDYEQKAWTRREERRLERENRNSSRSKETRWFFGTGFEDE